MTRRASPPAALPLRHLVQWAHGASVENSKKRPSSSPKSTPRANPERAAALHDEAHARLGMVRQAAGNFAAQLPSVEEWATFVRREIAPVYNAVAKDDRMCVECGKRTARDARGSVCSPACADRLSARGGGRRSSKGGANLADFGHDEGTAKIQLGDLVAATRGGSPARSSSPPATPAPAKDPRRR